MVSTGALTTACFWNIDVIVMTSRGRPVGIIKPLYDDAHVETRCAQYEALRTDKCVEIAKTLVLSKLKGQDQVLKKYGLRRLDYSVYEEVKSAEAGDAARLRNKLTAIEGKAARKYFNQIFSLFDESIRPEKRRTYKAFDGVNNIFNLGYKTLTWRIHVALTKAHLEPYLGYLHEIAFGRPSLICDFMELYRYLIDDYTLGYAKNFGLKDFCFKSESFGANKKGKRQYLNEKIQNEYFSSLNAHFKTEVNIPRTRIGKKQEIESLISEEAFLFAKYLRGEKTHWEPRIAKLR